MILADDAQHRDPEALGELMTRHSVAQVTAVPSLVSALIDSRPDAVRALSRLVCGGEPVSTRSCGAWCRSAPGRTSSC